MDFEVYMYLFHILLGVGVKLVFISGDFQMANMYLFHTSFHVMFFGKIWD